MDSWRQVANRQVVVVLTDLDRLACPLILLDDWLGADRKHPENLLLRIAEREVESWLLADHEALGKLLGSKARFPVQPDTLPDPKQHLLDWLKEHPERLGKIWLLSKEPLPGRGLAITAAWWTGCRPSGSGRAAGRSPSLSRARNAMRKAAHRVMQANFVESEICFRLHKCVVVADSTKQESV